MWIQIETKSMRNELAFLPYLPPLGSNSRLVVSLMFYDLERPLNAQWVPWIDSKFHEYGLRPSKVNFTARNSDRSGNYETLKKSLAEALAGLTEEGGFSSLRIRSEMLFPDDGFFPCEMEVSIEVGGPGYARGSISVVKRNVPGLAEFSLNTAREISHLGGTFYGHASLFPAILGPEYYLGSVGTIPKGWSFVSTRAYTKRLTAWRHHGSSREHVDGYLREVFPINFLTDAHLNTHIGDQAAKALYVKHGELSPLVGFDGQHVWRVADKNLKRARSALEKLGLVLSAR